MHTQSESFNREIISDLHQEQDLKFINLSEFTLNQNHLKLLQKDLSFSPSNNMDEFEVFKDISFFLRKTLLRAIHEQRQIKPNSAENEREKQSLQELIELLNENESEDLVEEDIGTITNPWKRKKELKIKIKQILNLLTGR